MSATEDPSQTPSREPAGPVLIYPTIMMIAETTPNEKDPDAFDVKFAATIDKETLAAIYFSSRTHGVLAEIKLMDPRARYEP